MNRWSLQSNIGVLITAVDMFNYFLYKVNVIVLLLYGLLTKWIYAQLHLVNFPSLWNRVGWVSIHRQDAFFFLLVSPLTRFSLLTSFPRLAFYYYYFFIYLYNYFLYSLFIFYFPLYILIRLLFYYQYNYRCSFKALLLTQWNKLFYSMIIII